MRFVTPKKISIVILLAGLTFGNLMVAPVSLASTYQQIINGAAQTGTASGFPVSAQGKPQVEFIPAFSTYVNGFFGIIGAFFMVLMIYAGFLWMSAQGNDQQVERAKKIMIGSVIGLAVIISGRLIAELALIYLSQTIPT